MTARSAFVYPGSLGERLEKRRSAGVGVYPLIRPLRAWCLLRRGPIIIPKAQPTILFHTTNSMTSVCGTSQGDKAT